MSRKYLLTCTMEPPYCEMGCGERATSKSLECALCDDCMEDQLREALAPLMGKVCANISRRENGYLTTCLAPSGVEHIHD